MLGPFKSLGKPSFYVPGMLGVMIAVTVVGSVYWFSLMGPVILLVLPFALGAAVLIFKYPHYALHFALVAGFVATGLSRYIAAPTGLLVDFILALGFISALFMSAKDRPELGPSLVSKSLPAIFSVWMVVTFLQIFNPQGGHILAWFYAMRGVILYPLLIVWIGYLLKPDRSFFQSFLVLWAVLSVIGSLWGMKQLVIGLDPFEQRWLSVPGNLSTHMLFGKLRVFSFFSDSGQFGAAQGHMAVVAGIMALGKSSKWKKIVWALVSLISLYGLLISGTRGALAVPAIGGIVYLILCKNWKVLIIGIVVMGGLYGLLRFSFVGQEVYEIRRMRTAVVEGSENASLQVRKANQERLSVYLQDKPFGGGVGSAGYWGQRFTPGTFLADLALDSWYVKIWAEYGSVGLSIYLFLLLLLCIGSLRAIQRETDPAQRHLLLALFSGFIGILVASYGNQVLGQVPTGIVIPVCLIALHQIKKSSE